MHQPDIDQKLSSMGRKYFHLIEFDDNEELIAEMRKHPFGLFLIVLTGILVTLGIFFLTLLVTNSSSLNETLNEAGFGSFQSILSTLGVILGVTSVLLTFVYGFLYVNNVIFVTSEKIAQVLYINIFHRKLSQLSIGDVQDVTVTQKGIFSRIFNFGTLVIETAGEQSNYTFSYIPKPYEASKDIVGAHERNLVQYGN